MTILALPDPAGYSLVNGLQIVPSAAYCVTAPTNLVSLWQGEGNTWDSWSGGNTAGEYDISYLSGQIGEAFWFDGYSTYLPVTASATLNVGTNHTGLTLACWLKPQDLNPHPLIEWNNGTNYGVYLWMSNALYANFVDTSGASHIVCSPTNLLSTNLFQYAVATYDGTYAAIYLNGTNLITTNLGSFTPQTSYNAYFGYLSAAGLGTNYYYGLLDEISLYQRALTGTEVNTLYLAGAASNSACAGVAPSLYPQPVSQTLTAGNDPQTFTVGAYGIGPFSYQWYYNGGVILGATGTSLSLLNVPVGTNNYSVIVSSSGGSTTSSNAVLTATNAVAVAASTTMVAWWQAEGNALDSEGAHDGAAAGGITYAPGKVGQAFDFDGTSGYVLITNSMGNILPSLFGLTIECWIKPAALYTHPLFEFNNGSNVGTCFWLNGNGSSLQANLIETNGTQHILNAPWDIITSNTWQHVALTYDETNAMIYYNGQPVLTNNLGGTNNLVLQIGQYYYSAYIGHRASSGYYYAGLMDEVSYYNRALPPAEILGIYNAGTAGKIPLPPGISPQPSGASVAEGSSLTLGLGVLNGSPPLSYQWQFNGTNLAGATNASLALPFLEPAQFGTYAVAVTNGGGYSLSSNAVVSTNGSFPYTSGAAWIWGRNDSAQGDPTISATNLAAVAGGYNHTLVLQANGTVAGWGDNTHGETTIPAGLTNVQAIAAGNGHSLALSNGTVYAWGNNANNQCNVPGSLTNVIAIAANGLQSLALQSNGLVFAWGATSAPVPALLTNATAIAAGDDFCVALSNGVVIAWGASNTNQLSVPTGLTGVVAIAAGGEHALALKSDGTVTNWGGSPTNNVPAGLTGVLGIAAGYAHSLALKNDGTVVAWGDNTYGQTSVISGLGTTTPLGTNGVKAVAAGAYHSLALQFSPLVQYYPLSAANDLLLVYNTNSTDSGTVMSYYTNNRPMVANANILGIGTPSYGGTYETISQTDFTNTIAAPITTWLSLNPTKRPEYVLLFLDVPSRVSGYVTNIWPFYQGWAGGDPPSVSVQLQSVAPNWLPLATHLNMTNVADCEAYITKLKAFGTNNTLVISASAGGYGNTNYVVDNVRGGTNSPFGDYTADGNIVRVTTNGLAQSGVPASAILYAEGLETNSTILPHLTNAASVAGYISWGYHSSLWSLYATTNAITNMTPQVKWTTNSNWYLIRTEESFNGMRYGNGGAYFSQWFAPTAFGGTNYANTPVAAVSYTDEPGPSATANDVLFQLWSGGNNFAICAWASRNTTYYQAVGDPFIKR